MIAAGPIICRFDQERLERASTVLVLSWVGSVKEVPLPTVWVAKSRHSKPGNAICGQALFDALWELGDDCEDADHRVVYLEEESK